MADKQHTFQQIIDVSMEFAQAKDIDLLLEKILETARELANAEVGSIYIMEGGTLRCHHTGNGSPHTRSFAGQNYLYHPSSPVLRSDSIPIHVTNSDEIVNIANISELPNNIPYTPDFSFEEQITAQITSLLAFPLKDNHGKIVGVIQLLNMRDASGSVTAIAEDDIPLIQLFANNVANAIERAQATRARVQGIIQILTALRDTEETVAHVNRVGAYASEIYETWAQMKQLAPEEIAQQKDILRTAAMLHDIGKLAIPSVIRKKPGKLSQEEYDTMKEHTLKGAQLLLKHASSEIEEIAAQIALTHHERWDGKGYPGHIDAHSGDVLPGYEDEDGNPRGKKGDEIPVFGRAVAIADVYDALTNHRVFREAWKEEDVLQKLKAESGTHFDPEMINAFFACLETIRAISKRFPDS